MPFSDAGKLALPEGTVAVKKVFVGNEEQYADDSPDEVHQQEE